MERLLPDPLLLLDLILSVLDRMVAAADRIACKVASTRNEIALRRWNNRGDLHDMEPF